AETSGTTSVEVQCPECGGTGPTEEYSAYVVCLDALGYSTWDFAGISVRCGEDEEFQVVGCACGTRSRPTGWIGGLGAVLIAWLGSRRRGGPMSRA
ncbi:MAG: hypothetical protein JXB39_15560, partial [Deltaproteobacteria bacterium]|nr:hypothetical protein [Deltaproteobacteria bacterium]